MNYPRYEISCDGGCNIIADDKSYVSAAPIVEVHEGFIYLSLPDLENDIVPASLEISSVDG